MVLTVSWTTQVFSTRHLSPHGDSSSRASPPWFSPAGWPGFPYIVAAGIRKSKSKTATPSKLGPELAQHHFFVFGILLVRTSHKASPTQGGWGVREIGCNSGRSGMRYTGKGGIVVQLFWETIYHTLSTICMKIPLKKRKRGPSITGQHKLT